MIREVPAGETPKVPTDITRRASVADYLETLNAHAPGTDLRYDEAILLGWDCALAIRLGEWDKWRASALPYFEEDDLEVIALAAVSMLARGPVPEPFATWIALARAATGAGQSPGVAAERVGAYLAPALPHEDGEDA